MSFLEKRNNLDALINISTEPEERSVVQVSFMTQDQTSRQGKIRNPRQNALLIHDSQCFPNPWIRLIYGKNPQSARFLRPHPSIRKPIQSATPLINEATFNQNVIIPPTINVIKFDRKCHNLNNHKCTGATRFYHYISFEYLSDSLLR